MSDIDFDMSPICRIHSVNGAHIIFIYYIKAVLY